MKKNDVFTFTDSNGAEVIAVVIDELSAHVIDYTDCTTFTYLCYAQNHLFTFIVDEYYRCFGKVIVEYAVLPDYDEMLARYNDIEVAQAETQNGM